MNFSTHRCWTKIVALSTLLSLHYVSLHNVSLHYAYRLFFQNTFRLQFCLLTRVFGSLATAVSLAACGVSVSDLSVNNPQPISQTDVPMLVQERHASVDALINGVGFRFVLDTGADYNVISPQVATKLGLKLSDERFPATGAGGSIDPVPFARIDDLAVGNAHLRGEIAFVIPLPVEFKYDGVLGANFFQAFSPRFDYANGRLGLTQSEYFKPPIGVTAIPIQLVNDKKILVNATAAGISGLYSIDTGAGNALTIFTPVVERYGLRSIYSPSIRTSAGVSVSGRDAADTVRLPEIVLGPHRFTKVVTELSLATGGLFGSDGWIGNLGAEIFRRFTVTINYRTKSLYLVPNANFGDRFWANNTGLTIEIEDEAIKVLEVITGSPAWEAGVSASDTIIAVNGQPATRSTLSQALRAGDGTRVTLRLRDVNGPARDAPVERDATLVLRELV
jgi:predicted aspartyl protease